MNKVELVKKVSQKSTLTKSQVETVMNALFEVITDSLKNGDKVLVKGFGTFEVSERKQRETTLPNSETLVTIPARKVPVFKASSTLRNKINS